MRNVGSYFAVIGHRPALFLTYVLVLGLGLAKGPANAWAHGEGHHANRHKDEQRAEQANEFRQAGADALGQGKLEEARRALSQSYEQQPAAETLYFLGRLALAEGRAVEAQDLFRRFMRESGEAVELKQKEEVLRLLAQPMPPFGELDFLGERGAFLRVDGHLLGVLPLVQPMLLSTGPHTVQLTQGSRRLDGAVEIHAGRTAQLRFDAKTGVGVVTVPPTVLLIDDWSPIPPPAQLPLRQAAERAIRGQQFAVLYAQAAVLQSPEQASCLRMRPCQEKLMQRTEVDFAISLHLNPAEGGSGFRVAGEILESTTGDVAVALEQTVAFEVPGAAADTIAALVARLLQEGRNRPRATLEVVSNPPGAEVVLLRGPVGLTPFQHAAFAGPMEVTVRKSGYQDSHVTANLEPGKTGTVQLTLLTMAPPPPKRPRWRTITGAVLVGVGGTVFVFSLLALAQGASNSGVSTSSAVGTALGGAVSIGGIVLLALPPPSPPPPKPIPAP